MTIPNPNQKYEDMTLMQKVDVFRAMSLFPAMTVMVFMRRKLGYRMLNPTWLLGLMIAMLLLPLFFNGVARPLPYLMGIYGAAMFGYGVFQRWLRWKELCRGVRWHSRSAGISYFEYARLPEFFTLHGRIYRYFDPAATAIVGLLVAALLSHGLGLWIVFSAFCLFIYEQAVYEMTVERQLDVIDGILDGEVQQQVVEHFQQAQPEQRRLTLEDTAGIPTGMAADIEKQVALRREKRTAAKAAAERQAAAPKAPPPDNLAKGGARNPA